MNEIGKLTASIEMLEARCQYLGIICSAMLHALPDKAEFLRLLERETQFQNANALYATSLSDRQREQIDSALELLVAALAPKPD